MTTTMTESGTKAVEPVAGSGIRFTVASRPQRRVSNVQTVSNLAGGATLAPIQLPATGFLRKIVLDVSASITAASAAALVAGDAPWNLLAGVTLTDATGQPIFQPMTGYHLYLLNKYLPASAEATNIPRAWNNPHMGPAYQYSVAGGTSGTARFRLELELEQDVNTGYGCIPNLDSNASLQLKIDVAPYGNAFAGTTVSAASVTVKVEQHYWAPVGSSLNGAPVQSQPVGLGDYIETRYETQTVSAASDNLVTITNRGGLIKGMILISRAAGARTDLAAGSSVGLILDNNPIDEGIAVESFQDQVRRTYGYMGSDLTTSYAPLTAGVLPGLDRGVVTYNFASLAGGRDAWMNTRVGSLWQARVTPGAGATSLEVITQLMQVRDPNAFYASSALD